MSVEADRARVRLQYWIEAKSGRAELFNLAWDRLLEANKPKTDHCKRGHPFDATNTYVYNGERQCRACKALTKRLERERSKLVADVSAITNVQPPSPVPTPPSPPPYMLNAIDAVIYEA